MDSSSDEKVIGLEGPANKLKLSISYAQDCLHFKSKDQEGAHSKPKNTVYLHLDIALFTPSYYTGIKSIVYSAHFNDLDNQLAMENNLGLTPLQCIVIGVSSYYFFTMSMLNYGMCFSYNKLC